MPLSLPQPAERNTVATASRGWFWGVYALALRASARFGDFALVTLVSQMQPLWRGVTQSGVAHVFSFRANPECLISDGLYWKPALFGDFGVSDAATVAGRYTRRGGPRLSVRGEPLIVLW